jgi:hypothetical protein
MANKPKKTSTVNNPTIKYAAVSIDGEEYRLAYNFRSIRAAEQLTGVNLLQGLNNLTELNAAQFHGLLFAAMLPAQPDITLEQVDSLIRLDTIAVLEIGVAEAYMNSMPKPKSVDSESPQQPTEAA